MRRGTPILFIAILVASAAGEAASASPAALDVRCRDGSLGFGPAGAVVEAQSNGVHVRVTNETAHRMSFGAGNFGGLEVRAGRTATTVVVLDPGQQIVACWNPSDPAQDPPNTPGYLRQRATVTVNAAAGWTPHALQCEPGQTRSVIADYASPPPEWRFPRLATRLVTRGLRRGDVVVRRGYPAGPVVLWRVIRNGRIIAGADFARDASTGRLYGNGISQCVGTLPADAWIATTGAPRAVATATVEGDVIRLTAAPVATAAGRRLRGPQVTVDCARVDGRVVSGRGRFLPGQIRAVIELSGSAADGGAPSRCRIMDAAGVLITFSAFARADVT